MCIKEFRGPVRGAGTELNYNRSCRQHNDGLKLSNPSQLEHKASLSAFLSNLKGTLELLQRLTNYVRLNLKAEGPSDSRNDSTSGSNDEFPALCLVRDELVRGGPAKFRRSNNTKEKEAYFLERTRCSVTTSEMIQMGVALRHC